MVKVSISLPNNAQITFESEEPEVIHEIVGMVLRDLPRDLMLATPPATDSAGDPRATENGSSVVIPFTPHSDAPAPADVTGQVPEDAGDPPTAPAEEHGAAEQRVPPPVERPQESFTSGRQRAQQARRSAAAELAFIQFCQSVNPMGDMRKVVVAAEGASQFLEMESVDAEDLEELFERVGWLQPHNFTQTLRNAARSKFRWLERVPGRSGHYTVTELGRTTTLNE